eukprot:scaffold38350_cov23-Tisochrysis_lutea.AAC.4
MSWHMHARAHAGCLPMGAVWHCTRVHMQGARPWWQSVALHACAHAGCPPMVGWQSMAHPAAGMSAGQVGLLVIARGARPWRPPLGHSAAGAPTSQGAPLAEELLPQPLRDYGYRVDFQHSKQARSAPMRKGKSGRGCETAEGWEWEHWGSEERGWGGGQRDSKEVFDGPGGAGASRLEPLWFFARGHAPPLMFVVLLMLHPVR